MNSTIGNTIRVLIASVTASLELLPGVTKKRNAAHLAKRLATKTSSSMATT